MSKKIMFGCEYQDDYTISVDEPENDLIDIDICCCFHLLESVSLSREGAINFANEILRVSEPSKDDTIKSLNTQISEIEHLKGRHIPDAEKLSMIFQIAARKAND